MTTTLTITDLQDTASFTVFEVPVTSAPIIAQSDVVTIDNNLSTYFTGSKKSYTFRFGYLDKDAYAILMGFRDRQYTNHKYPVITVTGNQNLNVSNMTAKMTLSDQNVIDNCGVVSDVSATFRESKQM